jgi:hypothetical protein
MKLACPSVYLPTANRAAELVHVLSNNLTKDPGRDLPRSVHEASYCGAPSWNHRLITANPAVHNPLRQPDTARNAC